MPLGQPTSLTRVGGVGVPLPPSSLTWLPPPAPCAGANAGFASSLFKLLWPDATVVSLEPDTSNFELLKANTKS